MEAFVDGNIESCRLGSQNQLGEVLAGLAGGKRLPWEFLDRLPEQTEADTLGARAAINGLYGTAASATRFRF
jgi:hypothetical protein